MSEITPDDNNDKDLEEKYTDDAASPDSASENTYTIELNNKEYELNEEARKRIQDRARHEYSDNPEFSCWWKTEGGDPILVIETMGVMVPWERLDQLELEMQTPDSFDGFSQGSNQQQSGDINEGSGMRTIDPNAVDEPDSASENTEKNRAHFGVTPQDFEEVPSPDGEDPDKIPPKPESFDEETMVMWIPDNPEVEHTWGTGEAMVPVDSWVEWNVQLKADQPRLDEEKDDSHDHWESILQMDDCDVVAELQPSQQPNPDQSGSDQSDDDIPQKFKDGKFGGNNWNV